MTKDNKAAEKNRHLAGIFAIKKIEDYVNEIRDAAYPQTPEQIGGPAYEDFNKALNTIGTLIDEGSDTKPSKENTNLAGAIAIRTIEDYVNEICDAAYSQTPEQYGGYAYTQFNRTLEVINNLLDGNIELPANKKPKPPQP